MRKYPVTILAIVIIVVGVVYFEFNSGVEAPKQATSNNQSPSPLPTFTENPDLNNTPELQHQDLIRLTSPKPNEVVKSPLTLKGEARGYWYFEASFPARIYDANGKELGAMPVHALSDWMTKDFVPFSASLEFKTPTTETGLLVLEKDNPSGLPENEDELRVPVRFQ